MLRRHSLEIGLQNDFNVLSRAEQVIFLRDRLFELAPIRAISGRGKLMSSKTLAVAWRTAVVTLED